MPSSSATWTLLDAARSSDEASASLLDRLVAPMALLVAMRWTDAHDAEQAAIAEFNGEEARSILPAALRWATWREVPRPLDGGEVSALWAGIRDVLGLPPDARGIHHELVLPEGKLLAHMVAWVDGLALDTPTSRRAAGEAFTDLVLRSIDHTRFGGELMTPRTAGRLMVAFADPRPGERIYDPCFGTGGLLVEVADALWARGCEVPAGEWARAQLVPMFGVEQHTELHLVAFVRLLLAGVRPALELGDALEREAAGRHQDQGFDCVLADPPWGDKVEGTHLYDFPIRGRTSENLFFQHAVRSLRPGGRAVLAVPPGLLSRDGPDRELREWLLGEYRVEAVLCFQGPAFGGLRSVPPALVLVRRAPPAADVAFVDLVALPDTVTGCRNLARAVLKRNADGVARHTFRTVPVTELLKADARLVVPADLEAEADEDLADLTQLVDLAPLSEVATVAAGMSIPRAAVVDIPIEGAVPIVRVGEISEGLLRIGGRYLRPEHVAKARGDQEVHLGVVLMSVDGTIGKLHHVRTAPYTNRDAVPMEKAGRMAIAQKGLVLLRAKRMLDPRFLAAVLASDTYQSLLRRLARGSTIAHLSLKDLRQVRVPVPPPPVQERVLRRLEEQPGDALEVLTLVLAGEDEDALSRLFRESPVFQILVGEAVPESSESERATLDVLRELHMLRNRAAHGQAEIPSDLLQWLLIVGAVPLAGVLQGESTYRYDALTAANALLTSGLQAARAASGLLARQAVRLTERVQVVIDEARRTVAGDFRFKVEQEFEGSDGYGNGEAGISVTLLGSVPVHDLMFHPHPGGVEVEVGELRPGEVVNLTLTLTDEMEWERHKGSLLMDGVLKWWGCRVDGGFCEGEEEIPLTFDWCDEDLYEEEEEETWAEYGVSPYITGDVVDDPSMFFGRQAVLDDICTHIGGGTKVILLEGNRRTGKTSILRQLQRIELGLLDTWLPVESSFQGTAGDSRADGISTEGIFRMLVRDIARATAKARIPVALPDVEETPSIATSPRKFALALTAYFDGLDPYEGLQIYVDAVADAIAPRRLLLMLDEFDKLQIGIDNKVTSPQVPENIRNLLQTRRSVAAIITGSRRLKRLREEYWSALFGFGHRIGVDPLHPSEVSALVRDPVFERLTFTEKAVDAVAVLSAGQPYLVQSLCARVFELAKRQGWRNIGTGEIEQAADRTVRDNEHFQALWSYAENERRRYLLWLCHALAGEPHRVNAALLTQRLERAGVVVPVEIVDDDLKFLRELELVALGETPFGPQYQLAIPLMRRWMAANVDSEAQRRRAVHEHTRTGGGSGFSGGYGYGLPNGSGGGGGQEYGNGLADDDGVGSASDGDDDNLSAGINSLDDDQEHPEGDR